MLWTVFCTGVAALAIAGLRGCDDEFFNVVFVVDEDVEQVRRASGVDVNVFFNFVLRLSHANGGGFVEDDFNALKGFFQGVVIADVGLDKFGMGVGVIRQFAVGVYLWVQVVKDAYAVPALDEFIGEVGADESHAAGDEDVFGGHLFKNFSNVEFFIGLWSPGQHVGEQARADELHTEYGEKDPEHQEGIPVLNGAGLEP